MPVFILGDNCGTAGRTDEARNLFEGVRGPYGSRAIRALGAIHHEAGRFDEAAKYYNEAMRANRGHDLLAFVNFQFKQRPSRASRPT